MKTHESANERLASAFKVLDSDPNGAETVFQTIIKEDENTEAYWGIAKIRIQNEKFDEAVKYLKISIGTKPNEAKYLYDLSFCLFKLRQVQSGLETFDNACRLSPGKYSERIKIANLLIEINELSESVVIYKQLYTELPNEPNINLNLGAVYDNLKKFEEAIFHFEKAIQIKPKFSKGFYNLATVQEKIGLEKKAIKNYLSAIEYDKYFALPYFNLGRIFFQNKEYTSALRMYDEFLKSDPNNSTALRNRCLIKGILGLFEGARRDAVRVRKLSNLNTDDLEAVRSTYYHTIAFDLFKNYNKNQKKINFKINKNLTEKNLEIVTFFVPTEKKYYENKTSIKNSWDFFLQNFYKRSKKILPNSEVILLTTNDAILPDDLPPYKIIRVSADATALMYTRLLAQLNYLESRSPNIISFFLDLDVYINKIPLDLISYDHHVSLTVRGFMPPVNAGVIYLSESEKAVEFFKKTKLIYDFLINQSLKVKDIEKADFSKWWGDQISICVAADIINVTMLDNKEYMLDEIKIRLLDCDLYNFDPIKIDQNLLSIDFNDKYFIHFKGNVNNEELKILEKFYAK
jgi:tetratricopeptide (TPR) repeat protein